jgi:alpha-mannosidase
MNTSWDTARFEVCAHKYADLSDGGYGVALMNDCKYGHDIHDGVIQLSLLRSPTGPNPEADQGEIPFTYSILLHEGSLADSDVAKQAYYLNYPMLAVKACGETDSLPTAFSAVSLDKTNVICEPVKQAEYGEDTVIRMYEYLNRRTDLTVTLGIPASKVFLCDLMENELEELVLDNGAVKLPIKGFEIVTLKVKA